MESWLYIPSEVRLMLSVCRLFHVCIQQNQLSQDLLPLNPSRAHRSVPFHHTYLAAKEMHAEDLDRVVQNGNLSVSLPSESWESSMQEDSTGQSEKKTNQLTSLVEVSSLSSNHSENVSSPYIMHKRSKNRLPTHYPGGSSCHPRNYEDGVSFYGLDLLAGELDRPASSAEECCKQCVESPRCTHWSWLQGGCALKNGRLVPIRSPWQKEIISARVALDLRSERLVDPQQSNDQGDKVSCEWDVEDSPYFLSDTPPK
jgi:hypothetical protein